MSLTLAFKSLPNTHIKDHELVYYQPLDESIPESVLSYASIHPFLSEKHRLAPQFIGHPPRVLRWNFPKDEGYMTCTAIPLTAKLKAKSWEEKGAALYHEVKGCRVSVYLDFGPEELDYAALRRYAQGILTASYTCDTYKTKTLSSKGGEKTHIEIVTPLQHTDDLFDYVMAVHKGSQLTRDLVNAPPNILYPEEFVRQCTQCAPKLKVNVLDRIQLEELGFDALTAVAKGSTRDPYVVVLEWNGQPNSATSSQPLLALVGKGVCFDSGGISIKPSQNMEEMKADMAGAATVLGAMVSFAERSVSAHVIGIVGLVENMPSGTAYRPGDIIKSLSKQTIEIVNTDAEGRLVLADLLTYVQDLYRPHYTVDLATLTGAMMVALGEDIAGYYTNDALLNRLISESGRSVDEQLWQMPLDKGFDLQIDSRFADMKNAAGRYGGACTAAAFLHRFIQDDTSWAHIDIAGVATKGKRTARYPGWATGWGVNMLNAFVDRLIAEHKQDVS